MSGLAATVTAAIGASVFASSVLGGADVSVAPPTPDYAAVVKAESLGGARVSLVQAVGAPDSLCLVVDSPAGSRLSGCGARADVLRDGAALSGTDQATGSTRTVWGYAPAGVVKATLGSESSAPSGLGFYVVSGRGAGVLELSTVDGVVQRTSLGPVGPAIN